MITRGTTPYHSFILPLSVSDIDEIYITYLQNNNVIIEKGKDDVDMVDINVETEDKSLNPENEINRLKKLCMAANFNPGKISWVEKELIEGNASGLESFVSFGGRI